MAEQQADAAAQAAQNQQAEEEFELTPEIMAYENRRTDLIISVAVLALTLFLAAIRDRSPDLWLRMRVGQLISETFPSPPKNDALTYAAEGAAWVNPNWLYDWATYQIGRPGFDEEGKASANGAALVGTKVGVCVLTILMLLMSRHQGPTLWVSAVFAGVAAIGISGRIALSPEVVANFLLALLLWIWFQARHAGRFGLLYLSIPVAVLWANVDMTWPIACLLLMLAAVGEWVGPMFAGGGRFHQDRLPMPRIAQVLVVAAACGLAGLATPYGFGGFRFPVDWFMEILPKTPSFEKETLGWTAFDFPRTWSRLFSGDLPWAQHAWFGLIAVNVAGFLVNVKSFSVTRLLWSLAAVGLPFVAQRYQPTSCILLALSASLNLQEFFIEYWGTESRITRGWVLWSQVGRAATILLVFGAIFCAFTGRVQNLAGAFGFGIRHEHYMASAAQFLNKTKPAGHCLSFTVPLAGFRAWAMPGSKDFTDQRFQVTKDVLAEFSAVRRALQMDLYPRPASPAETKSGADAGSPQGEPKPTAANLPPAASPGAGSGPGAASTKKPLEPSPAAPTADSPIDPKLADVSKVAEKPSPDAASRTAAPPGFQFPSAEELAAQEKTWKEIFDKYKITHIAIDPRIDARNANLQLVLNNLLNSPHFTPVFLSDQAMIFGRIDDSPSNVDRALFLEKSIKANRVAFREKREPPKPTERPALPPGMIDRIWRTRAVSTPGVVTAETLCRVSRNIEQPGGIYLSIQHAREALAENPDSGEGYFALELAYNSLFRFEAFNALVAMQAAEAKRKAKLETDAASAKAKSEPQTKPEDKSNPATPGLAGEAKDKPAQPDVSAAPTPTQTRMPATNDFIAMRHYQIMGAARSASIAQPNNAFAQLELYKLCLNNRFFDSALFHLREARKLLPQDDVQDQLQRVELALETEVKARRAKYDEFVNQRRMEYEQQGMDPDRPFERASIALGQRLTQLAMEQIESASAFSPDLVEAGPFVVGLYLTLGYPDRALQPLQQLRTQQRRLAPGEWSWLMGQIQLMAGQYAEAVRSIETALAEMRAGRVMNAIEGFDRRVRDGELTGLFGEATSIGNDVDREARYLFTLGLVQLEMGEPDQTLKSFRKCLTVSPNYGYRSVIAAYWPLLTDEKLAPAPEYDFEKSEIKVRFARDDSKPESKSSDSRDGSPKEHKVSDPPVSAPVKPAAKDAKEQPTTSGKAPADQSKSNDSAKRKSEPKSG